MVGDALRVVAGRGRDDAARPLLGVSVSSLLSAPRSLKAPVRCRFSILNQTAAQPVRSVK